MKNTIKSNLKTAGTAVAGGAVGGVASTMMNAGLAWGMSESGEEINQLETLQFETESGTVTLEDTDANGVYDAVVVEETEASGIDTDESASAPPATSVSDDMSFSEAFAAAREEVGPGGIFAWNGNVYGTYYKEEWEGMDSQQREEYWASVHQAEQENEYLANVYDTEPVDVAEAPEAEIVTVSAQAEIFEAEPVALDLNDDGINETVLVDLNEDGTHDAVVSDTNNDGQPDLVIADTDHDGELDSYARDTDHDGTIDESGTLPTEEPHVASTESFGNDYDSNADVSDMV